jgi:malonyl-CoA O-methyltransferase
MRSFERFAHTYGQYNVIQKKIIKKYINELKSRIIDLGCGSEGLCKYRKFDFYLGIDKSENMLKLNPCKTIKADFNEKRCYKIIKNYDFEQIVSFSALQWAKDLKFVFEEIKKLNKSFLIAIFTSNTFRSLHKELKVKSPIYSKGQILKYSEILKPSNIEVLEYEMQFDSPKKLLEYIKFSGVAGNVSVNVGNLRRFLKIFPVKSLEFEIIVLKF